MTWDWRGVGADYLLWEGELDEEKWREKAEWLESWKLKAVRLGITFYEVRRRKRVDYNKLDRVLDILNQHGVGGIVDFHYKGEQYDPSQWPAYWADLAENFSGDDRIYAYELFGTEGMADIKEQWPLISAKITDAIREVDPGRTVIWPPVENIPEKARRDNVVYKFGGWSHTTSVSRAIYDAEKIESAMEAFRQEGHDVWLAEFGVHYNWIHDHIGWEAQKTFCEHLVNFCYANNIGFCFYGFHEDDYDRILNQSWYLTPAWKGTIIGAGIGTAIGYGTTRDWKTVFGTGAGALLGWLIEKFGIRR